MGRKLFWANCIFPILKSGSTGRFAISEENLTYSASIFELLMWNRRSHGALIDSWVSVRFD